MEAVQRSWKTVCLDDVSESDVVFAVDTSGSMYPYLPFVKREIVKWLRQQEVLQPTRKFNLVYYSALAEKWQAQSLSPSSRNVADAEAWLSRLHCSTTSNVIDALTVAFSDPFTDAVCLLTDGSVDNPVAHVLEHVARISRARPVHVILFQHETTSGLSPFRCRTGLAERLVLRTGGRVQLAHVPRTAATEHVRVDTYVKSAEQRAQEEQARCRGNAPQLDTTKPPAVPKTAWELIQGMHVVARRDRDGVYYSGRINDQLDSATVTVKFNHSFHGNFDSIQATPICDVISLVDSYRKNFGLGDSVLAQYGEKEAYYPGTVTEETYQKMTDIPPVKCFTVTLYDGTKVHRVNRDRAIRITADKSGMIVKELKTKEKILLGTTSTDSLLEEKLLERDLGKKEDKGGVLIKTESKGSVRTESSSYTASLTSSESTDSEASIENDSRPTPGTVLSLGLSFSEGYKAGFADGLSKRETQVRRSGVQFTSPKPANPAHARVVSRVSEARSQNLDIDAVIQSRRHQCHDFPATKARSFTHSPSERTADRVMTHQRSHTADPAGEREERVIEYKRLKRREWLDKQREANREIQAKQGAIINHKRTVRSAQLERDANRFSSSQKATDNRVLFLAAERLKREAERGLRDREELARASTRDQRMRTSKRGATDWQLSLARDARQKEQLRQDAFRSREVHRQSIKTDRWEAEKRLQEKRVKDLRDRQKARDASAVKEENKTLTRMELEQYADSHKRSTFRNQFIP